MELITVSTQIERRRSKFPCTFFWCCSIQNLTLHINSHHGNQLFKDDESYWLNHGDQ